MDDTSSTLTNSFVADGISGLQISEILTGTHVFSTELQSGEHSFKVIRSSMERTKGVLGLITINGFKNNGPANNLGYHISHPSFSVNLNEIRVQFDLKVGDSDDFLTSVGYVIFVIEE